MPSAHLTWVFYRLIQEVGMTQLREKHFVAQ